MHRIRWVSESGKLFRNTVFRKGVENLDLTAGSTRLTVPIACAHERFLCSGKSAEGDKNDTKVEKDGTGTNVSEKDQARNDQENRSIQAKAKLNSLLQSIVQQSRETADKTSQPNVVNLKLAAPLKETKPKEPVKTEDELNAEHDLGKEIVSAVKRVAETLEGDPKVVESELVQKLRTQVGKKINLSEVFAGMKIDRSTKATEAPTPQGDMELSRAHRVRRLMEERTREPHRMRMSESGREPQRPRRQEPRDRPTYIPIDLFGGPPLGIFTDKNDDAKTSVNQASHKLKTWDALHARDLKLAVTHPPANGFEEMILWTEQGKMWKFPIDNEQGLDEEAKVPFHEHVFLEPQIEGWCPKKGPIRHFMELVCVGLSKNPFLTVKEKHEQIEWYHQFFKEKETIIKEVGAGEIK